VFAPPPLPRTLEASIRDLSSQRPATRASAVTDLARHAATDGNTRIRAISLFEHALSDEAAAVRASAAVALADLRAAEALPALLIAIEDPDVHVRQMALSALGEIADTRAQSRLRRALTDSRPEVRYQAVIAFSRVAKDDAAEITGALALALSDADEAVRYIALRIAEERVDAGVSAGLSGLASRAKELLSEEHGHVALAAAILLAKLGDESGRALVLRVTQGRVRVGRGPEKEDEREALEVAGAVQMREAIPALERRAWGLGRVVRDTCAYSAKIALARMGHERALAEIKRDLSSTKRAAREAAVVAAGRARVLSLREQIASMSPAEADPALISEALKLLDDQKSAASSDD
jgi:HEAT repeat protein